MNEFILIRHGHAQHLANHQTGGWTNSTLTELGRLQAHQTGSRIHQMLADSQCKLYSSDLPRCSETAAILGQYIGCTPVLTSSLRDLNNGMAANHTLAEAEQLRLPITQPVLDWIPYPGAESWRMMRTRVVSFLEQVRFERLSANEWPRTILVTHANPIVTIIQWWLQLPEGLVERTSFTSDPCSLTRLTIDDWGARTIDRLNDVAHLWLYGQSTTCGQVMVNHTG